MSMPGMRSAIVRSSKMGYTPVYRTGIGRQGEETGTVKMATAALRGAAAAEAFASDLLI